MNQTFERRHREITSWREHQIRTVSKNDIEARQRIDGQAVADLAKLLESCEAQLRQTHERYPNIPYNPRAYSYLYPAAE